MDADRYFTVQTRLDVDQARREARRMAERLGFDRANAEAVALAVSELAMNLHRHAVDGTILLRIVRKGERRGIEVQSSDLGPGIADPVLALQDGYSTVGSMGSGLPGARRLMDDFDLVTGSAGTRIVACKWLPIRSTSR